MLMAKLFRKWHVIYLLSYKEAQELAEFPIHP